MRTRRKAIISMALGLGAAIVFGISASASWTYTDSIVGGEFPNATQTEGQFAGTAFGDLPGGWFIDVTHEVLRGSTPVHITGGTFALETTMNYRPVRVTGTFVPYQGTITQTAGFGGCHNQKYWVEGAMHDVGIPGRRGTGGFRATLTHYRHWVWRIGCVIYSASVSGSTWMSF